jgi:hypothetical protein
MIASAALAVRHTRDVRGSFADASRRRLKSAAEGGIVVGWLMTI